MNLSTRRTRAALALLVAAFATLRIVAVAGMEPISYPDTPTYLRLDFMGGELRLWTVPLLYTALPDEGWRMTAQVALGIVCWSALAIAVARTFVHPAVALAAAAAVLMLGLTVQVTQWDLVLYSESVALSLMVLTVALGLVVAEGRPSRTFLAALGGALVLWVFARHVNATAFVLLFPLAAGLLLWRLPRRPAIVAVACLALVAAWSAVAVKRTNLWGQNGDTLLVERLLQDPDARRHFAEHGLTITPGLLQEVRVRQFLPDFPQIPEELEDTVLEDPRFNRWFDAEWNDAHAAYLLENAPTTLTQPLRRAPRKLAENPDVAWPRAVLPGPLQDVLWSSGGGPLWILLVVGGGIALWLASLRRGPPRPAEIVPWALIAVAVIEIELAWNSTATEIPRLFLPAGAALVLASLLLAAFAADRVYPLSAGPDSSAG